MRTTRPVDDQPGHEALVDAHRGRLLRLCRLLLRDLEETKDVVQDVFKRHLFRAIRRLRVSLRGAS